MERQYNSMHNGTISIYILNRRYYYHRRAFTYQRVCKYSVRILYIKQALSAIITRVI